MPRKPRFQVPGVPAHVVQRGNNRQPIFFEPSDYSAYLSWLHEGLKRYGCELHAYVLMTNHVRLLLTPKKTDSAGLLMKRLGHRYVRYVNRFYRRSGTLWEGGFQS